MATRSRASAPGKVILMGEHAAVYGRPALVAALDLRCDVEIEERSGGGLTLSLPDLGIEEESDWERVLTYSEGARRRWNDHAQDPSGRSFAEVVGTDPAHLVKVALGETAREAGAARPPGARVLVRSEIPCGAGFGSSAALAVALPAALLAAWGESAEATRIERVALEIERRQHGFPSGVDHATVLAGGVVHARRDGDGRLAFRPLEVDGSALSAFRLFHTGEPADGTGEVVAAVRARFARRHAELDELLDGMESETISFAAALSRWSGEARGVAAEAVRGFEACLERLDVVPAGVRTVIRALEAGGAAAKISGAGSTRGPGAGALLVLPPSGEEVEPAGPVRVTATLGAPGLSVEGRG
ncbi:MAG: hypothetical protein R2991_08255 [Thermoanaerobaculia bacterium]